MKQLFILTLICGLLFSCRTASIISIYNPQTLEIAQKAELPFLKDTLRENNLPVVFTADKDSVIYTSTENWFPTVEHHNKKNKTIIKYLSSIQTNIIAKVLEEPESKKRQPTKWHLITSISILLASILWLLVASFPVIGIIGIVLALMIFVSAFTDNSKTEPETPIITEDEPVYPYNLNAKLALIFFLLSLGFMVSAVFIPILLLAAIPGFPIAFILSILALLDIKEKGEKERGKLTAQIILALSAIPTLFILYVVIAMINNTICGV